MAGVEGKTMDNADEVRTPPNATVEVVHVGDVEVGRFTFQPGWRWSESIKPIVGTDSCQLDHLGYIISGAMRIEHEDGTALDATPGAAYVIRPGHDAWVVGDEPVVAIEFKSAGIFAKA